jgi:hypothetical protein
MITELLYKNEVMLMTTHICIVDYVYVIHNTHEAVTKSIK